MPYPDIKEPRDGLIDYVIFRFSWVLIVPIGWGAYWVAYNVLGIRDLGWLVMFVGLGTSVISAAIVYWLSTFAEPDPRRKQR